MNTYADLLTALQTLERAVSRDLLTRCRQQGPIRDQMLERHRAEEVGGDADSWLTVACGRAAVQFLLRTVYVRALEDLGLLAPLRLRGHLGYQVFRELAPNLGYRGYFSWIFRDLARDFPSLFLPGPAEPGLPGEDMCAEVWNLWHAGDGLGNLRYDWSGGGFDSRFLGDLYQDLDADVRKQYALLQTPEFVESYILDYTLTPALAAFDPAELLAAGGCFRLLDPTCGSGHFLLGGFRRLLGYWRGRAPDLPPLEVIQRALDSVWGCDINPYAVAIAQFRLLLAARDAAVELGAKPGLDALGSLRQHLLAADSLVPWEGGQGQHEPLPGPRAELIARYATAEEREANRSFFARDFHAIVGNPPYITPKDAQKRDAYRVFWPESCYRQYALTVPFTERFFDIAARGGFVGLIIANSFMKREFGKMLIEKVLPKLNLTHVIDTQGAYIPGHGTPTVILFGTNEEPKNPKLKMVLGIRGEPKRPNVPELGLVWTSITNHTHLDYFENSFITVVNKDRRNLAKHPWSVGGGGAADLRELIEQAGTTKLYDKVTEIGFGAVTREDDVFMIGNDLLRRAEIPDKHSRILVPGDAIRDYAITEEERSIFPYAAGPEYAVADHNAIKRFLWQWKRQLSERVAYGKTQLERNLNWFEYSMLFRYRLDGLTIAFANIATHNHFSLDRGEKIFKQTSPVIKLPPTATEDDHLDLLGLLNSSTLGFWMRQVMYQKGGDKMGDGARCTSEIWLDRLSYDPTKLESSPITYKDRESRISLARQLDELAQRRFALTPGRVLSQEEWRPAALAELLAAARQEHGQLTAAMCALQEDLDWLTYASYGLADEQEIGPMGQTGPLPPGHRPFEIALARRLRDDDFQTRYFELHGRRPQTEIPDAYAGAARAALERRLALIAANPAIALLEQPEYKRRWQPYDYAGETRRAAETWLLDRLEGVFMPGGELAAPQPQRIEEIAAAWRRDERVSAVAALWANSGNFHLEDIAAALLKANSVPDNPYRIFSVEGLRKYRRWQWTWAMQDQEDARERNSSQPLIDPGAGEPVRDIPVPPSFTRGDFLRPAYFQIRGKLNVPRERFIEFADLDPPRYGWAGWRGERRGQAQVRAFELAESHPTAPLPAPTAADPRRCGPSLGLWDILDGIRRWSPPDVHEELRYLAQDICHQSACPCQVLEAWQAWLASGGKPRASEQPAAPERPALSIQDRARAVEILEAAGENGLTLAAFIKTAALEKEHARVLLDELAARGEIEQQARPRRYRAVRRERQLGLGL